MSKFFLSLICSITLVFAFAQKQAAQKEAIRFLIQNEAAIINLAKEIPEDQYHWRPAQGVRDVGSVFLHIAASNYFIMMNLGIAPPSEIDLMAMESIKGKEKIIETVHTSFQFVFNHLLSIKDNQLKEKVKFPFAEMTKHAALYLLIDHSGEHKGQQIAYARSIGVAPPWSR